MKIQNLLHQPLELDFGKDEVVRFGARETREVKDKFQKHPVIERNRADIRIVAQKKAVKEKAIDAEAETK